MNEGEKEQLRMEIQHIFDSGANEIRVFEMVKSFIESRNGINKLPIPVHIHEGVEHITVKFEGGIIHITNNNEKDQD